MDFSETAEPNREPSAEELDALLNTAFDQVAQIITEHAGNADPDTASVPASTHEANEKGLYGFLTASGNDRDGYEVKVNEIDLNDEENSTVERFKLNYVMGVGNCELATTGKTPKVVAEHFDSDAPDEQFTDAVALLQEYLEQPFYPATAEEIQRFAKIVKIGALGDDYFDFESFETQFNNHVDGSEN